MKKEPGPYFHLSLDGTRIEDLFNLNLGFYKIPTMAFYGENYPYGDPLCIVRAHGDIIDFPENVLNVLQSCETTYMTYPPPKFKGKWVPRPVQIPIPEKIEFYWVVSDITELQHKGQLMNLVNHSWAITDYVKGRRIKHIPNCILPICGVEEVFNAGVKFGEFRAEYMSMHFKSGCLSLSPNNHKVFMNRNCDICKFWTISLSDEEAKAVVSLQWVLNTKRLNRIFTEAQELSELVRGLQDGLVERIFSNLI